MARILLAHPLFLAKSEEETASASPYFPLGVLYIASFLREAGNEVGIFDGTFEPDEGSFSEMLDSFSPDVVGLSAVLPTRDTTLELARRAAEAGAVVLVGGPDATTDPEGYLAEEAVDVVVHHEGEQTIARLLELFDAGRLSIGSFGDEPGIAFRNEGQVVMNAPRAPVENLDDLPPPARDLIDMTRYLDAWTETAGYSSITVSSSRGCPYGCEWCVDSVHGTEFRQRSPESVAAEFQALAREFGVDRVRLVDDVDGIDRSWFERFAKCMSDLGEDLPFEALNDVARKDIPLLDVRDSL